MVLPLLREVSKSSQFQAVLLPALDRHQRMVKTIRQSGIRNFIGNGEAPVASRLKALVALQAVPTRVSSPVLRELLSDGVEDLRLLAYGGERLGQGREKAREFFKPYRPSSPQIAILKDGKLVKMIQRQDIEGVEVSLVAERADEPPKVFTSVKVVYTVRGRKLSRALIERAVSLSEDKYCSATAMIRKSAAVSHEVVLVEV